MAGSKNAWTLYKYWIGGSMYLAMMGAVGIQARDFFNNAAQRHEQIERQRQKIEAQSQEIQKIIDSRIYSEYSQNLLKVDQIAKHQEMARTQPGIPLPSKPKPVQEDDRPIDQKYPVKIDQHDVYYNNMQEALKSLQEPIKEGDKISERFEARKEKLIKEENEESDEIRFYRAHQTILNMYITQLGDRIQHTQNTTLQEMNKELTAANQLRIEGLFGEGENVNFVTKTMTHLMQDYKYQLLPEYGPLANSVDENKIDSLSDEELELMAVRLQEHVGEMKGHLEASVTPELKHIKENVELEHIRMQEIINQIAKVSKLLTAYKDLEATLIENSFEIMDIK